MKISVNDKKMIAAKAAFIEERISGSVIAADSNNHIENVLNRENNKNNMHSKLIRRWAELTSDVFDDKGFERRLKLTSKSLEAINALTGPVLWNDEKPLPEWISTLEEFFKILPASYDEIISALPSKLMPDDYYAPFQHVWAPWLLICRRKLKHFAGRAFNLLSVNAEISWLRYILNSLNTEFALCLNSAFELLKSNNFIFFSMPPAESFPEGSKTHYNNFSRVMLEGGWLDFFKKYSVAARLISNLCECQALYLSDVLKNYEKDADKIEKTFNQKRKAGRISDLEAGLSDFHNGGKNVIKLKFKNGLAVYYKPRTGKIDTLWDGILNWLASKIKNIKFKTPVRLNRQTHTWVENIQANDLIKKEETAIFYYKAGAILALIYVLGGTDFHQENLIACGSEPVLIDLETLLSPSVKPFNYTNMDDEDKKNYHGLESDSVLRTCMLPLWTAVSKNISRDYGALTPDDDSFYSRRKWLDINTDKMRRGYIDRKNTFSPNIPRLNGKYIDTFKYKENIIKGFKNAYKIIMNNGEEFLNETGRFEKFKNARIRYLTRQSQVYADMIDRLRSPALMRDGAAFSIESEGLAKPFLNFASTERIEALWKLFEAERGEILSLNIPLFEFTLDGLSIYGPSGKILSDYFLKTAVEQIKRRTMKLSAKDLEFQSNLIDASFLCRYPDKINKNTPAKKKNNRSAIDLPLISDKEYIKTARSAAYQIAEKAVYIKGKPQWLTLKTDPESRKNFIGPIDLTLYEGASGIGLFLCAYEKLTGDRTYRTLAIDCFSEIEELLNDQSAAVAAVKSSCGYCGGMPGIFWALYKSGNYIQDERLIAMAKKGENLLNAKNVKDSDATDIIGGAAGGALAFSALYEARGNERLIELVKIHAKNLINKRFKYDKWNLWPSDYASKPLTGFAHGAAGYALSLAKAYELTRIEIFKEAALEAIDYETSNYMPEYNNWPDFRHNRALKTGETAFMAGWCSGAPGIGLARIKMPKFFHDRKIKTDIENALSFTINFKHFYNSRDHLCCGGAGRIDFLIEASIALNRLNLMEDARKQFSFIVNRAALNGGYTLPVEESKSIFMPGLFTGLSGIGLTALRLIDPKIISSALTP